MSKAKKILHLDERGRITLPKEVREDVETYELKTSADGTLRLVPLRTVSLDDAKILDSLKKSIREIKKGKGRPVPDEWIE